MAIDLIKSYLIGIGFNVDSNSIKDTEESINQTEQQIKKFNENSKKGFSESSDAMKSLFSLLSSSSYIGRLFPELQKPFNGLIKDIKLVKKLYNDLSETKINKKEDKTTSKNIKRYIGANNDIKIYKKHMKIKGLNENGKGNDETHSGFKSSADSLKDLEDKAKSLSENGGESLLKFSLKGAAHIGMFIATVVSALAITKKLLNSLNDLGNQDIEYEKLSRQLWTTKENTKDIDSALKTLGVTMEDLWLSPTLLKQFNQLRKDSQKLRLPQEFKNNIKVIQGLGLEFKRLKQLGKLAFQWIGNYILKYIAGPLAKFKQRLSRLNDKFIKVIPYIAKIIGSAMGIILRVLLLIFRVLEPIFSIIFKIVELVIDLIDRIPGPIKKILKLIGVIAGLIMAGPIGAIILIIALLDDLFTLLRGGKSVIGSVVGYFKEKGINAIESIKSKFGDLKEKFKNGMSSIKDDWNSYWEKESKVLDKLKDKAKEVWGDIKEWSKGIWDKTKDFFKGEKGVEVKNSVQYYNKNIASKPNIPPSYATGNRISNSTSTSNSNNKIANNIEIKVASNDPKGAANAIGSKIRGINTRNLQGAF